MTRTIPFIVTLSLLACAPAALGQQTAFSSLEEKMTAREFRDSGLDKLSEEELARLNEWLREWAGQRADGADPGATAATPERRATEMDELEDGEPVVSRIDGEFLGWTGDTEFRLQNGQVWKQASSGTFFIKADSPRVTIEPGVFGSWYLSVEGYNTRVRVKRIE